MAIGDAALNAGMQVMTGNEAADTLDTEINLTRDYIAERTNAVTPTDKGGTGATTPAGARANLGITPANLNVYDKPAIDKAFGERDDRINGLVPRIDGLVTRIDGVQGTANDASGRATSALQGNLYPDSYNRQLAGIRRAAWLGDNGQLGHASSSERYKKYIRAEDVTDEQVLALALVSYQWRAAVAVDDRREMGLIAERLEEAGLGWACFYNEDGTVEGINYDHVGIALIPAVQRLIRRVSRLEEGSGNDGNA